MALFVTKLKYKKDIHISWTKSSIHDQTNKDRQWPDFFGKQNKRNKSYTSKNIILIKYITPSNLNLLLIFKTFELYYLDII